MEAVKSPVMIYTEQTPNPETLKFVTNKMLYNGTADFKDAGLAQEWSPFASELHEMESVKGVYISNNFVTITKENHIQWDEIMLTIKAFIKEYVAADKIIITEGFKAAYDALKAEEQAYTYSGDSAEIVQKIKDLIESHVKPAVEMDGGNIEFKSYNEGIVTVIMQGACSGCPSSTVTLKAGIEGMLKRMIPQVKEVVSEMG